LKILYRGIGGSLYAAGNFGLMQNKEQMVTQVFCVVVCHSNYRGVTKHCFFFHGSSAPFG
jgi:hypothetical protein